MGTIYTEVHSPADAPRKRWTREQADALAAITLGQERVELVEGELISKMGKKRPHTNAAHAIGVWLRDVFGEFFVQTEVPIDVAPEDNPTSEPEPDLIVTDREFAEFRWGNPRPNEIRLLVEVSDATIGLDTTIKARLYARAGFVEYWVADIAGRRIIVHRDPADGQYHSVIAYAEHESIAPLSARQAALDVRRIYTH